MSDIEPQLLTVEQTCQFLNISRALLYSRLSCECFGIIPIRIGRKVLFSRKELQAYIDAGMPPRSKWQAMKQAKTFLK
jgi:predicted DNA-binding transcriptional regulator AlpA